MRAEAVKTPGGWLYCADPDIDPRYVEGAPLFTLLGAYEIGQDGQFTGKTWVNDEYRPSPRRLGLPAPENEFEEVLNVVTARYLPADAGTPDRWALKEMLSALLGLIGAGEPRCAGGRGPAGRASGAAGHSRSSLSCSSWNGYWRSTAAATAEGPGNSSASASMMISSQTAPSQYPERRSRPTGLNPAPS